MATWAPITGAVVQRVLSSGLPASGYVLKLYAAGTSINIPLATDTAGATQANYAVYNATGDVTVSGNTIIPHVDQDYKLCIYATQAAADANSGAVLSIDNIPAPAEGALTVNDAENDGVTNVLSLYHTTSGVPVAGIGTGLEFITETSTPGTKVGAVIESVATDVSVGSEDFDLVVKLMSDGVTAEKLRVKSSGQVLTGGPVDLPTGSTIASASTINLDAATGGRVHITGTTAITAVTLTKGPRTVIFDDVLTLTHHATNNNLPGGANITTGAGDRAIYESDGVTVYCIAYFSAQGGTLGQTTMTGALDMARATVASHATTADIWAAAGNQIDWTGTATTTSFPAAPQAGASRTLICAAACSFTAGANMLIQGLSSGQTVTMAANDKVRVEAVTTTQFHVTIERYSGYPVKGGAAALLAALTPTAAANVDALNVFTSEYNYYKIVIEGVVPSADDSLRMRFANAGVVDTSASCRTVTTTSDVALNDTQISVTGAVEATSSLGANATVEVINANSATLLKSGFITRQHASTVTPGDVNGSTAIHMYGGGVVSGFRLFWNSGANFGAQGKVFVYGYRNS